MSARRLRLVLAAALALLGALSLGGVTAHERDSGPSVDRHVAGEHAIAVADRAGGDRAGARLADRLDASLGGPAPAAPWPASLLAAATVVQAVRRVRGGGLLRRGPPAADGPRAHLGIA